MKKILFLLFAAIMLHSCSEPDSAVTLKVNLTDEMPQIIEGEYQTIAGTIVFDEINTGMSYNYRLPGSLDIQLPVGVYNISGEMQVQKGTETYSLKTSVYQYTINADTNIGLKWLVYNPNNTLVFGEIYFTGSLNAKGTGGIYDTYFTVYNNTDQVQYADGLAIVESKLLNSTTDKILTPANQRDVNFTAQAIYVIPGSGKDVPVQPGEYIKIVDSAIDWSESVPNGLNHTDADFEWYDESTSASVVDIDNPAVTNLDKWFCYSLTIWLPSNQCNRSYALVRFPQGMTMDKFLAEQNGAYEYVNAATGNQMKADKCYLIDPQWIIDGVNLCPTEKFTEPVLPTSIDRGYAAISSKNSDVNRFGKKFVRKVSGVTAAGKTLLQDTDNSAADFEIVEAK